MGKTYEQGKQDGLELYGRVCCKHSSCQDCMIGALRGDEITCQEFMSKFPSKMVSLLTEMDSQEYTYYDEFVTRFPNCGMTVDELSKISCRKAIYEGYVDCDDTECKECWLQPFEGDVTVSNED